MGFAKGETNDLANGKKGRLKDLLLSVGSSPKQVFREASIRCGSTKTPDLHHGGHLVDRKIDDDVGAVRPIQLVRFDKPEFPLQLEFFLPSGGPQSCGVLQVCADLV